MSEELDRIANAMSQVKHHMPEDAGKWADEWEQRLRAESNRLGEEHEGCLTDLRRWQDAAAKLREELAEAQTLHRTALAMAKDNGKQLAQLQRRLDEVERIADNLKGHYPQRLAMMPHMKQLEDWLKIAEGRRG